MPLLHRLMHRWDNEGLRSLIPGVLRGRAPAVRPSFIHPFDLVHGTDTSGFLSGKDLAGTPLVRRDSAFYTTAYYAIAPSTLRQALAHIPIPPEDLDSYTFVDLGCGKGRALLVAAERPFANLLGVDLSPQLCEIARLNTQPNPRIAIRQQDATTLEYPQTGLVLFLYHPFLAPVLRKVLASLSRQWTSHPRPVYLLYASPSYAKIIACYPFLEQVWDYAFDLSKEDAAADRHGVTKDRYTLYKSGKQR